MANSLYTVLSSCSALFPLYAVLFPLCAVLFPLYAVLIALYAVMLSLYGVLFSSCVVANSLYAVLSSCSALFPLYAVLFVGASASTMLSSAEFICLRVAIARSSGRN